MKITAKFSLFVLLTLAFPLLRGEQVWAEKSESITPPANQTNNPASQPVVGSIQMRNQRIVMKAGGTYTVYSKDGQVLLGNVTLEQLQAFDPSLREFLERSIARDTLMMDASLGVDGKDGYLKQQ
jgi:hypothetical protein